MELEDFNSDFILYPYEDNMYEQERSLRKTGKFWFRKGFVGLIKYPENNPDSAKLIKRQCETWNVISRKMRRFFF